MDVYSNPDNATGAKMTGEVRRFICWLGWHKDNIPFDMKPHSRFCRKCFRVYTSIYDTFEIIRERLKGTP